MADPADVRNGLDTAAGQIKIGHFVFVEDAKCIAALRRTIDVAVGKQRCRCDEKDLLLRKPAH
jgi:hypothetical protein